MDQFFTEAAMQDHPLQALRHFLSNETNNEAGKKYNEMRFVGYILDIGYDTVTIITSDPYKLAVGGIPRNSLLIMVPSNLERLPLHFTLLRVLESAPTPLSREVQQTYFELQKKSMPELDVFTQGELQWGALKTGVLGMFYPNPEAEKANKIEFSGDLNNFVSAHKYRVFAPDDALLRLIVNCLVPDNYRLEIGNLRLTECRLPLPGKKLPDVTVYVSADDFMGARTAMFGKTRLGKSNVVKLIAQSILEATNKLRKDGMDHLALPTSANKTHATVKNSKESKLANPNQLSLLEEEAILPATDKEKYSNNKLLPKTAGQLIFDINGEYANDNPQDGSSSLGGAYPGICFVYALNQKASTQSRPLRLDFYERPDSSHKILTSLMHDAGKDTSNYVSSFLSVDLPPIKEIQEMKPGEQTRPRRKVLIYWAILSRAGYIADEEKLKKLFGSFDPGFSKPSMEKVYGLDQRAWPEINSLDTLCAVFEKYIDQDRRERLKSTTAGKDLFDSDDLALLGFLKPASTTSTGPKLIQPYRKYHDCKAGDFVTEILQLLDSGFTVILDLGNAPPEVLEYFSDYLSRAVFSHQVEKFSSNNLGSHYIQLYFEEAHNLFPNQDDRKVDTYRRIAKEGAKYQIGLIYSTQSVTTISRDLLGQTENFFIAHLSSQDEVNALAKIQIAYESLKNDILQAKTPGYIRMLTRSHRFVVSVQAKKFTPSGFAGN